MDKLPTRRWENNNLSCSILTRIGLNCKQSNLTQRRFFFILNLLLSNFVHDFFFTLLRINFFLFPGLCVILIIIVTVITCDDWWGEGYYYRVDVYISQLIVVAIFVLLIVWSLVTDNHKMIYSIEKTLGRIQPTSQTTNENRNNNNNSNINGSLTIVVATIVVFWALHYNQAPLYGQTSIKSVICWFH